jgi:hypothetical protein
VGVHVDFDEADTTPCHFKAQEEYGVAELRGDSRRELVRKATAPFLWFLSCFVSLPRLGTCRAFATCAVPRPCALRRVCDTYMDVASSLTPPPVRESHRAR